MTGSWPGLRPLPPAYRATPKTTSNQAVGWSRSGDGRSHQHPAMFSVIQSTSTSVSVTGVAVKSTTPVRFPDPRNPAYAPVAPRTTQLPVSGTAVGGGDGFGGKILCVQRSWSVPSLLLSVRTVCSAPVTGDGTAPNRACAITVPESETLPERP